jgi:hypothetical protein
MPLREGREHQGRGEGPGSSQKMVESDGADQQGRDRPESDEVTDDGANATLPSPAASSLNTMPRCIAHQLSPASAGRPQNMPRRRGFGSPSIQRHPRKSASVSAPLLPPPTSSQMRRALLLGTSVAMFASRATLGSVIEPARSSWGGGMTATLLQVKLP